MTQKLSPSTIVLLSIPPLMWAGNAIVAKLVYQQVPPVTLNFLRWALAFCLLLPFSYGIFKRGSGLWQNRKHLAILGLLGFGVYNALQYMTLKTSSPLNVTLVASSMPVWMLLVGKLFFNSSIRPKQLFGVLLSIAGVILVLSRGELRQLLELQFVAGDLYMLAAGIAWSYYSWLLSTQDKSQKNSGNLSQEQQNQQTQTLLTLRNDWSAFLLAQISYGLLWSGMFAAAEWQFSTPQIEWSTGLLAALLFIAVGPAILAFRCWSLGVQRAGPSIASFFSNLTPLFTAILSSVFLAEMPHVYHLAAFGLIAGGIVLASMK